MTLAGYFLGNLEFFQKHFEAVVIGIILLSVMPMVIAYLRHRFNATKH
jgi:membrane-associated protein